jgi:diguanylate cyclase (GGDEF)-like protein
MVAGVLCLSCAPDLDIDIRVFHMLSLIGNELGIAISNAQLYESAKYSSLHDPLTGLANRRLLEATLPQSIARAVRSGTRLSAILIDIDHFKKYNDTRGHVAGDRLLKELGKFLAGQTRKSDLAVRYGGEEFLLLLHETGIQGAGIFAEQLRRTVEMDLDVTISLGVAEYSGARMNDDEFIALADSALYRAKAKGRNRTEIDIDTGPAGSEQGVG